MRALNIASTGMMAQTTNISTIANNLSNMSTTGYKQQKAAFADLMYQNRAVPGAQTSDTGTILASGIQQGLGVRTQGIYRITTQGDLSETDNTYDLAISGKGYFRIELPTGDDAYTRDGNFTLSSTGLLVTQDGYTVQPGITIPTNATDVTVSSTGLVQATVDDTTSTVGQIELNRFPNEAGLQALGDNLLIETDSSGAPVAGNPGDTGYGEIEQGYLESSNVDAVSEITNMITAQRAYEMCSKVITATSSMMQTTAELGSS